MEAKLVGSSTCARSTRRDPAERLKRFRLGVAFMLREGEALADRAGSAEYFLFL